MNFIDKALSEITNGEDFVQAMADIYKNFFQIVNGSIGVCVCLKIGNKFFCPTFFSEAVSLNLNLGGDAVTGISGEITGTSGTAENTASVSERTVTVWTAHPSI